MIGLIVGYDLPRASNTTNSEGSDIVNLTNGNAGTVPIGTPVYSSASGAFDKARANASGTSTAIGVTSGSVASGGSVDVTTSGAVVATTAQWDAVTGGTGGLTFNTVYYLDAAAAGKLTATPPAASGQFVEQVGIAVSTICLIVQLQPPIGPLP